MKKIFMIVVVLGLFSGCTRLPESVETGTDYLINKNEQNDNDLENADNNNINYLEQISNLEKQIEDIKNDYTNILKDRDISKEDLAKLQDLLKEIQISEKLELDKDEINKVQIENYLKDRNSLIKKSLNSVEIVGLESEDLVLFYTNEYGDELNHIFVWEDNKKEPQKIDGGEFLQTGDIKLIHNKYILLNTGIKEEYKVIDIKNKSVINTFKVNEELYLIPDTVYILYHDNKDSFVLQNIITKEVKALDMENKTKFKKFKVENDEILFVGDYTDKGISYALEAKISIDSLIETYKLKDTEYLKVDENNKDDKVLEDDKVLDELLKEQESINDV